MYQDSSICTSVAATSQTLSVFLFSNDKIQLCSSSPQTLCASVDSGQCSTQRATKLRIMKWHYSVKQKSFDLSRSCLFCIAGLLVDFFLASFILPICISDGLAICSFANRLYVCGNGISAGFSLHFVYKVGDANLHLFRWLAAEKILRKISTFIWATAVGRVSWLQQKDGSSGIDFGFYFNELQFLCFLQLVL